MKCEAINLGCFGHCENIVLPYIAQYTDIYDIHFQRNGLHGHFQVIGTIGENIVIPAGRLNEAADIHLKVTHKYDLINGIMPQVYFLKTYVNFDTNELYTY